MRQSIKLFQIGLRQLFKDGMLLVLLPTPFLVGFVFKFGIPFANSLLEEKLSLSLMPWYGLVDGMLICLTPMFVAMISAFLLLEEQDEGISTFYGITPIAGYSYLVARIGIPMIWVLITTIVVAMLFSVSSLSAATILTSAIISSLTGISLGMMVVSLAGNRVEGLAISKLMGISFLGLIILWFVPAPYYYFAAFLPTFWVGKLLTGGADLSVFIAGLLSCSLWLFIFTKKFLRKIA